jgi:hypothetical protein
MDDDSEKSVIDKFVETVKETVSNIAATTTEAAKSATKPSEPEPLVGTAEEQLYDGQAEPGLATVRQEYMEEVVTAAAAPNKRTKQPANKTSVKKTAKRSARKPAVKAPKKAAKKLAKKPPKKSAKKATKSTATKKNAKKAAPKKSKKNSPKKSKKAKRGR